MNNHRPNMESKKTLIIKLSIQKVLIAKRLTRAEQVLLLPTCTRQQLDYLSDNDHSCLHVFTTTCVCVWQWEREKRKQKWILLDEYHDHYLISLWSLQKKEIVNLALSYSQTNKNCQMLKNQNYKRRNFSFKKMFVGLNKFIINSNTGEILCVCF